MKNKYVIYVLTYTLAIFFSPLARAWYPGCLGVDCNYSSWQEARDANRSESDSYRYNDGYSDSYGSGYSGDEESNSLKDLNDQIHELQRQNLEQRGRSPY